MVQFKYAEAVALNVDSVNVRQQKIKARRESEEERTINFVVKEKKLGHITDLENKYVAADALFLSVWSDQFLKQTKGNEIFLPEFEGYSKDVGMCLELMRGKTVTMDFWQSTTFLMFSARFCIAEITAVVKTWFDKIKNDGNLVYMIEAIISIRGLVEKHGLDRKFPHVREEKSIYDFEPVYDIGRKYLEEDYEAVLKIMKRMWPTPDVFQHGQINFLLYNHPVVKRTIPYIQEKLDTDKHFVIIVDRIEFLLRHHFNYLVIFSDQSQVLIDDIATKIQKDMVCLRKSAKLMELIYQPLRMQCIFNLTPDLVKELQIWAELSETELQELVRHRGMPHYQYTEAVLDWVTRKGSDDVTTLKLFNTVKQDRLGYRYLSDVRDSLTQAHGNIPAVPERGTYRYTSMWSSSPSVPDTLSEHTAVKVAGVCGVTSCTHYNSHSNKHCATLQLNREPNGYSKITVIPADVTMTTDVSGAEHTHEAETYEHFWFSGREFCSVLTKTYRGVRECVAQGGERVNCLMRIENN